MAPGFPPTNPVNTMRDPHDIRIFVHTFSKTGTTSFADSAQACYSDDPGYTYVAHSHREGCWHKHVPGIARDFSIPRLIREQITKPIVVQLFRNPVDRMLSDYIHQRQISTQAPPCTPINMADLSSFLQRTNWGSCDATLPYYEATFGYRLSDLRFDHAAHGCVIHREHFVLVITTLEHQQHWRELLMRAAPNDVCLRKFKVRQSNVRSRQVVVLPPECIDRILAQNKRCLRFFYTEAQVQCMHVTGDKYIRSSSTEPSHAVFDH